MRRSASSTMSERCGAIGTSSSTKPGRTLTTAGGASGEKPVAMMRASERESEDIDNKVARIELLEERVSILIKFCDKESRDVEAMDQNLTGQIEHAKEFMMAEIKGVALDLAKIRAWKERLMLDHPELKSTTEPSMTFRKMRRPTKMSDPPPSAPPRPGEEWKQTFNYPRRAEN